jgi:hypothetical protein
MRHDKFILDGKTPVPVDLMTWAKWFETADDKRVVAKSNVGDASVSTVFLGLNHQWGDGPPLLFETIIFGGEHNEWQDRCSTWKDAEAMHQKACALVRGEWKE